MSFGNFSFWEIMLILLVVLLLFGAKRLPEMGRSLGKGITEFKRSLTDVDKAIREPDPDARVDRSASSDRLHEPVPERRAEEESRPEPKRLLG